MEINRHIDYTLLRPDVKEEEMYSLCEEAKLHNFRAVCIPPLFVKNAKRILQKTATSVCSVAGFPLGYVPAGIKLEETEFLIGEGVEEVDMVANIYAFVNGKYSEVREEISAISRMCKENDILLKVIIESGLLDFDQVRKFCKICEEAGADFVKTSTGFAKVNAEISKVKVMRDSLPASIGIKASGGIRDYPTALEFLAAGASRIGTSTLISYVPA